MPQLRQNIITGDWVVIAPERAKRPSDFIVAHTAKPEAKIACVFCPEGEPYQKQNLKNFETDQIFVIPNSYPAFIEDPHAASARQSGSEENFYHAQAATGGHDVIVVKDHDRPLFQMSDVLLADLLTVAQKRYIYWRQDRAINYSMLIYNHGSAAGASLTHPHAQLFASNIIPNQVAREVAGSAHYWQQHQVCIFCRMIDHERRRGVRMVAENDHFVAFTFYAARFPFEIWIVPKHHQACFEQESPQVISHLGQIMHQVFHHLGKVLNEPPLNFYIHDVPVRANQTDHHYHWHLEITPRVTTYGGYELGSGVIIDVMAPEEAAEYLKQAH